MLLKFLKSKISVFVKHLIINSAVPDFQFLVEPIQNLIELVLAVQKSQMELVFGVQSSLIGLDFEMENQYHSVVDFFFELA